MQVLENLVKVSGKLHLVHGDKVQENRLGKYVRFSVRQDTPWNDGSTRHDFLIMRAYDREVQEQVFGLSEGAPIKVEGQIRSSVGSGEMYILVKHIETDS